MMKTLCALAGLTLYWATDETLPASAQTKPTVRQAQSWTEEKCARYAKAWNDALARRGTNGLGVEFLASHAVFLATGCTANRDVCPRSPEEFELANIMTIAAMNAGSASTFPPFACRK